MAGHLLLGMGSTGPSRGVLMFMVVATAAAIALRRLGSVNGRGIHAARYRLGLH